MEKRQIIEAIRAINTNAESAFLEQFDASDLRDYLNRLEAVATRSTAKPWANPTRREFSKAS